MPTVCSVSDITNILSSIIQKPILQDVKVQGEVLVDGPQNAFFLRNGGNRLRCFIPGGNIAKFKPLLKQGNTVIVNGKITLFSSFSQYQLRVNTISKPNFPAIGVNKITENLQSVIETAPSLKNIHVQGKISDGDKFGDKLLDLCDAVGKISDGLPKIKCVSSGVKLPPVKQGDEVCLRGKFSIYPQKSLYQIDIGSIELVPSGNGKAQCQCTGCKQCLPLLESNRLCNRHCNAPGHVLCPTCYEESPDPEDLVKDAVYDYFDGLEVKGFSPDTESQIQFGSRDGSADVVLADGDGTFAVIAECKGSSIMGYGIEQLKSYLCATDTRFGVFANSTDGPDSWSFFENLRYNQFQEIDRSEFEKGIVKGITLRKQLKDEIKSLESNRNQLRAEIGELETEKAEAARQVREESEKLDAVKQAIESDRAHNQDLKSIQKHLSDAIEQLRIDRTKLETEVAELERKERELYTTREQRKEKIQQLETLFNDLKSGLLDLEPSAPSEDNTGPQKSHENKNQGVKNWFKNRFSKENK